MALTKKDLEAVLTTQLQGVAKTADIDDLRTHIDASIASLEKKVDQSFESVDIKLSAIHEMLDVRKRVDRLEQQMAALQGHR
jgi:polyhydroxyalkanoate synthesis regulator phasin